MLSYCAVAAEAALAALLHNLHRLLNGTYQYLVRVHASAAFGCGFGGQPHPGYLRLGTARSY